MSLKFGKGIKAASRAKKPARMAERTRSRKAVKRSARSTSGTWQNGRHGLLNVKSQKIAVFSWRLVLGLLMLSTLTYALFKGGYIDRLKSETGIRVVKLLKNSGFGIEKIEISGQAQVSDNAVLRALGIGDGISTLTFDTDAAQKRLEKHPWVRRATVMRLLPSTLRVDIEETKPEMVWQKNNKLYLVDGVGDVIAEVKNYRKELPLLVGAGANKDAKQLLTELQTIPEIEAHLKAALRVSDRRWTLVLRNGTQIWLPEQHYGIELRDLVQQRNYLDVFTHNWGTIDLRINDRIVVQRSRAIALGRRNSSQRRALEMDREALLSKLNQGT